MVDAEYRLATETLGLKHLRAVMGISMGGMQTFEWMVDYPDFMDEAIPIVGSPRLTGYDLLLWHTEEDALRSDPAWQNGHYTPRPPLGAVEAVHQMNLTTPANYARAHPPEKFAADYAAYFTKGILPFDANDWLYQLEAMIHHDAAHGAQWKTRKSASRRACSWWWPRRTTWSILCRQRNSPRQLVPESSFSTSTTDTYRSGTIQKRQARWCGRFWMSTKTGDCELRAEG
jgi:pimeloyl-ACP methyl ester carboxylesterase